MNVTWSVMFGEAPTAPVTDPGPLGIEIPDVIAEWAAAEHGWGPDSPDIWIAVAPEDSTRGAIDAEIGCRDGVVSEEELASIEEQLEAQGTSRR
jgi:hypothetical protein